jgi:hypothetical protein
VADLSVEEMLMAEASFQEYFAAASAHPGLSDREKAFIGLAVTLSRGCEP